MHHFESPSEVQVAASFPKGSISFAWSPFLQRETEIGPSYLSVVRNDSTGVERKVRVRDTTSDVQNIFIAFTGSYYHHNVAESGTATRQIDGEVAVGAGSRGGMTRIDAVAALGGGYYYALDHVAGGYDSPPIYRAATVYHLRPSLSLGLGLTGITDSSRTGVAFGLIGRISYPIVLSSSNEALSQPRLMWDAGWYFHIGLGRAFQVELQVQEEPGIDYLFDNNYGEDIWSYTSAVVCLRVRLYDLF